MPNISVTVCDDIRIEASRKLILIGVYMGEIIVPFDNFFIPQLNFLFHVDCPREKVPKRAIFEVELPGSTSPQRLEVDVATPNFEGAYTRWIIRQAITFANTLLLPGKIEARVILDEEVFPAVAAWIKKNPDLHEAVPHENTV